MVKIKVCGVRDQAGAIACEENAVDYIGFNFVSGRRRAITPEDANELQQFCPSPQKVGVFFDQPEEYIYDVLNRCDVELVQLHGDESPDLCSALREKYKVIKAFSIDSDFVIGRLKPYISRVDHWLFDAPTAGAGKTFDWQILHDLGISSPFWLAGGLAPHNIEDAIHQFSPSVVDTASGVEVDKNQCPERIREFCTKVRRVNEANR